MCSYAATWHIRRTQRLTTRDDVRLDLTIAHLSQCPVTTPRLILHPPRVGNIQGTYTTAEIRHILDLHVGDYTSACCGRSALLLQKFSLEPLYSDHDTSRRDNFLMLTYLHYLQYEKRQPTLQVAVGSTEILSV